jgi:DNA repair exonuclease SbcCD ATPase subunit
MKLLSLKAHNVFSIGTIELDLKDRGLLLVTGWSNDDNNGNMAGKSSVANHCVSWGLYGRTVHGVKADAVINTSIKNAKHCGVTINFEGIDGKKYRIYRARKPKSLVLSALMDRCPDEEWEDLSQRNEKDTQALIDQLLGRDHKTFIQSDFFGQGRERSFLALPGSEQRAVIEEILPLTSLDTWYEKAKALYTQASDKVSNAQESFRMQGERVSMAIGHLKKLTTQEAEWNADNLITLAGARNKLNKIQLTSSGIEQEIENLKEYLPTDHTAQENLDDYVIEAGALTLAINNMDYKIDSLTSTINMRAARPDVCTACDQPLPAGKVKMNEVSIVADKEHRELLVQQRGESQAKHYNNSAQMAICQEVLVLESKIKTREEEAGLKELVRSLSEQTSPFALLVSSANEEYNKEQRASDTYRMILELEEQHREHCIFWRRAFGSDIKTLLFEQVCPFLESKTNQYLRDLGNGQIKVSFSTTKVLKSGDEKDEFCVTAKSDTGSTVFELFSGAEKQLTSFAVGMALSDLAALQTQGSSSFMILDEPFLYQSPENCERIVSFITNKLSSKSTILLISNEDNLVNLVPNRVHVVKNKGVTSIE